MKSTETHTFAFLFLQTETNELAHWLSRDHTASDIIVMTAGREDSTLACVRALTLTHGGINVFCEKWCLSLQRWRKQINSDYLKLPCQCLSCTVAKHVAAHVSFPQSSVLRSSFSTLVCRNICLFFLVQKNVIKLNYLTIIIILHIHTFCWVDSGLLRVVHFEVNLVN